MSIQDKIIKWWVQNVYSTNMIKYEPGFIITEFNNQYGNAFQRLVVIPEDLFVEIEKQVVEKHGEKGEEALKNIGREYGYNFAYLLGAPTIDKGQDFISRFLKFSINYGFSSYAKEAQLLELDFEKGHFTVEFKDRVICRKSGIGHILDYTMVGFMEYILKTPLKVVNTTCQGRGDESCKIFIESSEEDMPVCYFNPVLASQYRKFNALRPINYSTASFSKAIKDKTVSFEGGIVYQNQHAILTFEAGILFLLSQKLGELNFTQSAFEIAFKSMSDFMAKGGINKIEDLLAVWGWGDTFIKNQTNIFNVYLIFFPWYPLSNIDDFSIIRGMLSAFFARKNQNITLQESKLIKDVNNLTLLLK